MLKFFLLNYPQVADLGQTLQKSIFAFKQYDKQRHSFFVLLGENGVFKFDKALGLSVSGFAFASLHHGIEAL